MIIIMVLMMMGIRGRFTESWKEELDRKWEQRILLTLSFGEKHGFYPSQWNNNGSS